MVVVFDMDDTLFDELTYVRGALLAVAQYMEDEWGILAEESHAYMLDRLQESRSHILDKTLSYFHKNTTRNLRKCISVYRLSRPAISLFPEAVSCLERFKNYPCYVVTDGNKTVQGYKIRALGLDKMVKRAFITYHYGRDKQKPSPYCFVRIASLEKADPNDIWYIGDNPKKDFVGIKSLGFRTVRVLQGQHQALRMGEDHEADITLSSLNELTPTLLANY